MNRGAEISSGYLKYSNIQCSMHLPTFRKYYEIKRMLQAPTCLPTNMTNDMAIF